MKNPIGRRLTATPILAMAAEPPNWREQLEQLEESRRNAGSIDLSFWASNPWVWTVIAFATGVLTFAILAKQGFISSAQIGFAGNDPKKAASGGLTLKHAGIGVVVALLVGLSITAILGLLVMLFA